MNFGQIWGFRTEILQNLRLWNGNFRIVNLGTRTENLVKKNAIFVERGKGRTETCWNKELPRDSEKEVLRAAHLRTPFQGEKVSTPRKELLWFFENPEWCRVEQKQPKLVAFVLFFTVGVGYRGSMFQDTLGPT